MEPSMGLPQKFISSMFNFEAYREFFRQSMGQAFLYIFVVSVVLAGLSGFKPILDSYRAVDELAAYMEADFPYFALKDGELFVDVEMPYVIEESPGSIFVIDTSGRLDESFLDDYREGILLRKHEMIYKENRVQTSYYNYQSFGFDVTREDVVRWIPALKWVIVLIIIFGFIIYFCGKLISALILSVAGLAIESITNCKIGFGNIYKLSLYALTLPMVITAVLTITGVSIPLFWLVYYGIAMFYLYKAITTAHYYRGAEPDRWYN